jgi:hypothetical protein
MKKTIKLIIFALLFSLSANYASSQFTFTVAPGLSLNGASFGYKIDRVVPEFGFNYMLARGSYTFNGKKYDSNQNKEVDNNYSYNVTAGYLLPRLGVKVFIAEKEDLKMFVSAGFLKPFIFGNSQVDGVDDFVVSDEIDKVSIWGADLSFGMEYFFSERFSMSGQFGFRYFGANYKNTYQSSYFDPNAGQSVEFEAREQFRLSLNPTFSRIGLNFYF